MTQTLAETAPDTIRIVGLVLPVHIGVFEHEYGAPQRVRFDVDITAVPDYRLRRTEESYLSYLDTVTFIEDMAKSGRHIPFVEDWAEAVAGFVLAHPLADEVAVTVRKLDVFEAADGVGIRIARRRA